MERLNRDVVHEICTNQVVVTLQACVKELAENALDAGATRLEVKLRENGSELLEVVDDGHGVSAENYDKLATRHATSKIKGYDDLSQTLNTFGFRGEALAGIAAMGEMTVCTRTSADSAAVLLTYDRFGKLVSQVPAAREVGTTVTVRELFRRLPVRHREFMRNAKAQVTATLRLVQAYAISKPEIRFHVIAEKAKGHGSGRATLLSSSGASRGWLQASAAVLGDAMVRDTEVFDMSSETGWSITGIVSTASGGRRSKDTQLFFVNRRPIEPPKRIAKLINDTYHQYNSRMYPVVIFSFCASQQLVDVNVTPDKKTVFLHNEEGLLADIQKRLTELYAPAERGPGASLGDFGIGRKSSSSVSKAVPIEDQSVAPMTVPFNASKEISASPPPLAQVAAAASLSEFDTPEKSESLSSILTIDPSSQSIANAGNYNQKRPGGELAAFSRPLKKRPTNGSEAGESQGCEAQEEFVVTCLDLDNIQEVATPQEVNELKVHASDDDIPGVSVLEFQSSEGVGPVYVEDSHMEDVELPGVSVLEFTVSDTAPVVSSAAVGEDMGVTELNIDSLDVEMSTLSVVEITMPSSHASDADLPSSEASNLVEQSPPASMAEMPATALVAPSGSTQASAWPPPPPVKVSVSMSQLEAAITAKRARAAQASANAGNESDTPKVHFPSAFSLSSLKSGTGGKASSLEEVAKFATSSKPGESSASLQFDQGCFDKMRVIGQFNLGFIIAALRTESKDDGSDDASSAGLQLFIVDQHASDEKVRFEALNRESKVDRQPLVNPHHLQLSPAQEQMAQANLEVFKLNGFDLRCDESRAPGRRLRLASLPTCQGLVFNERDIHDLLHTIEQAEIDAGELKVREGAPQGLLDLAGHRGGWTSTGIPRPHKVWQLLACRACRGAIMIGKALRVPEMEKVLRNLGQLQHPWNCPHGRPTMRHLVDAGAAWRPSNEERPQQPFLQLQS